jgi:hypothetical protein
LEVWGKVPSILAVFLSNFWKFGDLFLVKHKYDHAWIMHLIDEGGIKGIEPFYSEKSYINYMHELGIDEVAGVSTLNQYYNTVSGCFPNWTFSDTQDNFERLRRVNVARNFVVGFVKGK